MTRDKKWWKSDKYSKYYRDYNQLPRKLHSFKWVDHPLYNTWHRMKSRCYNVDDIGYINYGGRGIQVTKKWLFDFERFIYDMGEKPSLDYSIERMDNNGDYKPSNCKWGTRTEQNQNKRVYKTSKTGYGGICFTDLGYFQVRVKNTRDILGVFKTLDEAIIAQENETKQTAPRVTNTTGVRGVTICPTTGKFLVRKVIDGKREYLGNVETIEEANELYNRGVVKPRNNNKTGTTGISYSSKLDKFIVRVKVSKGIRKYIGTFNTLDEAKVALNEN